MGDAKQKGKGRPKPPVDEGAWKRPLFNASDYIYGQTTLAFENLHLDSGHDAGNPRPLDPKHVEELADALLANPPKELWLTTWENRGVSPSFTGRLLLI